MILNKKKPAPYEKPTLFTNTNEVHHECLGVFIVPKHFFKGPG
ncbi:MAG: hypothetical protein KIPDCIKN_02652 [Haliscomenobacter sp.]|jgi:hypothetical protein|nr:hypothetical protein [Haliscomenobacter sp.]